MSENGVRAAAVTVRFYRYTDSAVVTATVLFGSLRASQGVSRVGVGYHFDRGGRNLCEVDVVVCCLLVA